MTKRFDYIEYDTISEHKSSNCKDLCSQLEYYLNGEFLPSREQSLAITKLEECFMWIGKTIRHDQLERHKSS